MNVVWYVFLIIILVCLLILTVYTSVITFSNDSKLQRLNKTPSVLVSGAKDVENVKYVVSTVIERMPYLGPDAELGSDKLSVGDRVLVCGQINKAHNGIYVYDGYSLVRSDDLKTLESLNTGARVYVESNKTSYAITKELGTKTIDDFNKETGVEMWWYANSVTSMVPLVTFEPYMVNLLGEPSSSKRQFVVSDSSDKRKMRWVDLPFEIVDGDTLKLTDLTLDTLSVDTLSVNTLNLTDLTLNTLSVDTLSVDTLSLTNSYGLTKTDDTNVTLTLGGSPNSSLLAAVSLTLGWSGVLSSSRGGTGCSTYSAGDFLYGDSSGILTKLSGNTTQSPHGVLVETSSGIPSWTRDLYLASVTFGSTLTNFMLTNDSSKAKFYNANTTSPQVITTTNYGLTLEQTGDQYGATRLYLQNRDGVNGAIFEQAGSVNLIDFVFKSLTSQRNIRYEGRNDYCFNAAPEFQIGNPAQDQPTVFISDGDRKSVV